MSNEVNPYQSPEMSTVTEKPLIPQGALTETMLIYLKGASPWLRFVGILGFITSGLTAFTGISTFALIPLLRTESLNTLPGFEQFGGVFVTVFSAGMAVMCIGLGLLTFFPSLFIYRFGAKIRSYLRTGTEQDLEQALRNNKSLWKFLGILCVIYLAIIPVMIIGSIIVAITMAVTA